MTSGKRMLKDENTFRRVPPMPRLLTSLLINSRSCSKGMPPSHVTLPTLVVNHLSGLAG